MARITQLNKTGVESINADSLEATFSSKDKFTRDVPRVDNRHPELYIKHLIPNGRTPIAIQDETLLTGAMILQDAKSFGFEIAEHSLSIYSKSKVGHPRTLSNSELVRGNPFYGTANDPLSVSLPLLKKALNYNIGFYKHLEEVCAGTTETLRNDELDDAQKYSLSRTAPFGRHLKPPFAEWTMGVTYPSDFIDFFRSVMDHVFELTEHQIPPPQEAFLLMQDAKETSVGGPSFASGMVDEGGYGYHEKRIITLSAMPKPSMDIDPETYLNLCYDWGSSLGLPDPAMTFSAALSYRVKNAGHKFLRLFTFDNGQYVSVKSARAMEDDSREVFPASHAFNISVTPAVWQLKTFRKSKLGMDHRPDKYIKYVDHLRKQGNTCFESDFSNFDKSITAFLMAFASDYFARKKGKNWWYFRLLENFFKTTGAIYPSFLTDEQGLVTYFKHAATLLSGTLATSEIGSLISVTANLYALSPQIPNILDKWKKGEFVILVQSDDVLFTTNHKLDIDAFYERMASIGLKCKLKPGNMFLKKLLPLGELANHKFPIGGVPIISRAPQQTFSNETDYTGKPDAILRLALLSRSEGLNFHPLMNKDLTTHWKDILTDFPIFKPVVDRLFDGVLALSPDDQRAVYEYATSEEGQTWISQLVSRFDADPKSALTLQSLTSIGFDLSQYTDTALSQRRSYINALMQEPSTESRTLMRQILVWNRG